MDKKVDVTVKKKVAITDIRKPVGSPKTKGNASLKLADVKPADKKPADTKPASTPKTPDNKPAEAPKIPENKTVETKKEPADKKVVEIPKAPEKKPKKTKHRITNLQIAICAVLVAAIAIVLIVLFYPKSPVVDDNYFVTDDEKSVLNLEPESKTSSTTQTHIVYEYNGEYVSAIKTYFEYPSPEAAAAAFDTVKVQPEFEKSTVTLDGKYIVVSANEEQFKGLTASDVSQQIEAIEKFQRSRKAEKEQSTSTESTEEPVENSENTDNE